MGYRSVLAASLLLFSCSPLMSGAVLAAEKDEPGEAVADTEDDSTKFFLFHKSGVSLDQARGDLIYCIAQAQPILSMRDRYGGSGGLLGR